MRRRLPQSRKPGGEPFGEHGHFLLLLLFELAQDLLDHLPLFQADGQEDGFHWAGIGHVDSGTGMHFGPVKEAVKRLLVFLAQAPPEWKCLVQFWKKQGR